MLAVRLSATSRICTILVSSGMAMFYGGARRGASSTKLVSRDAFLADVFFSPSDRNSSSRGIASAVFFGVGTLLLSLLVGGVEN